MRAASGSARMGSRSRAVDESSQPAPRVVPPVREPVWRLPVALAPLGIDLLRLRGTPGLRFAGLLGTGRGATAVARTSRAPRCSWCGTPPLRWPPSRTPGSPSAGACFRARGGEVYGVRLARPSGGGRWAGRDVLADLRGSRQPPGPGIPSGEARTSGPVAVLIRATVHPSRWHWFRGSGPLVSRELAAAAGLRAAVGIGEAPVGLQATFSIWSDAAAVTAFARGPEHRAGGRRTRK